MANAASIVITIGVIVFTGWIFDIGILKSFAPGRIEMKLSTATAFVLIGFSFLLHARASRYRRVADVLAVIVIAMASLSLLEYMVGRPLLVDSLWKSEAAGATETIHPGRMALNTALAFVAAAIGALFLHRRSASAALVRRVMIAIVAAITLFVLVGYLLQAGELRGAPGANPMALSTAIGFLFCTIALGLASSEDWPMSLMVGGAPGARVARLLFAASLVIPLMFGWLRLRGELMGLYNLRQGVALFAVFNIVVLWVVAAWGITQIQHLDRARERTHDNLHRVVEAQSAIGQASLDRSRVAALLLEHLQTIAEASGAAVALVENGGVRYGAARGAAAYLEGRTFPLDGALAGAAIAASSFVSARVADARKWPDVVTPSVAAPLMYRGIKVGAVVLTFASERELTPELSDMLRLVIDSGASALVRAEQFEAKQTVVDEQWAELQTLQKQFQTFMNNIPAAAFIKDREGHYIYGNPALSRFLRVEVPEMLGMTDAGLLEPAAATRLREGDEAVLAGDSTHSLPVQLVDDPDAPYWLLLRFPLPQRKGDPFIGGVAIDITELKRAEAKIASMNETLEERILARTEELERVNSDLESFSYSVSHDLRAPLRAVDGYSRIIEEDYSKVLDAEGHRLLGVIRREARRMGLLIDDLLTFSRVGRQHLSHSMIDMRRLFVDALPAIRASRPDRQVDLSVGDLPPAFGDVGALRQVIVNLLSNAAKYAKPDGVIRIEVGSQTESGQTVYSVRDYGVGFDMKYAGKLFGVFQRLHPHDAFEGTGVGLAIVQRIVAAHGGRAWAHAEPGAGATFFFTLPASPPVGDELHQKERSA